MAPQVHRVLIQIRGPNGADPGQICEGSYIIEGETLVMTGPTGQPLDETLWRHQLRPGENADVIARMLTRRIRRAALGTTEDEEAFGRPLRYREAGLA